MRDLSRRGLMTGGRGRLLGVMASCLAVGVIAGGAAGTAQAATTCPAGANTWTGGANDGGQWGTPGNWSLGNAPGTSSTTEDVCLPDSATPYAVTLAPFQYNNNINNPPEAKIVANSLTVGSGASLVVHGASSNGNFSSSGGDVTMLTLTNGGSISSGGTLELLATDDNDGGGASDNGGRADITGATLTNAGTFTSVSQTTQGSVQSHQNELGISLTDLPGSVATVASGTLRVDLANSVTNQGTWTVASGATMSVEYNGFNQSHSPATSFVNDGTYVNAGTTVMDQQDPGLGNEESNPITWTQQGGLVTGNPIQFTSGAELADSAGTGSFLFNQREGQIAGTIPAGQTVTVEGDSYGSNTYKNTVTLLGSQVVNQGTLVLHAPNVSTDTASDTVLTGSPLVNQGVISATGDTANLANELDVTLQNAHGATLGVVGTLIATNGQTVTNDGTIAIAPGSQLQEYANQFLTGKETFINAADGTIAPQIAGASSFGTLLFGGYSAVNVAGSVAPALVGGYTPAGGSAFTVFPINTAPTGGTPTVTGTFGAVGGGFSADYSHETTSPSYIGLVFGAPAAGGVAPPKANPPKAKRSKLGHGKPSVKGTSVHLKLSCSKGRGCPKVTIKETIRVRVKGHRILGIARAKAKSTKKVKIKAVVVATHKVKLSSGKSKNVTVSLNKAGGRLLARFHRLRLSVSIAAGGKTRASFTATVHRSKKKRHRKHKHA